MPEENQITKTGIMIKTIFYKQETSFLIAAFHDSEKKEEFTVKGTMVNPQPGLTYKLTGDIKEGPNHGEQLNFTSFETVLPRDDNGIFMYIVRVCKFVGNKVGNDLVDKYGSETLTIMKNEPERVAKEIRGITLERANEIKNTLLDNEKKEAVMIELGEILNITGMRKSLAADLLFTFNSNAAEIIKENPYILTSFHGISFVLADRVAMNIGTDPRGIDRKKAAVNHAISQKMSNGHIWVGRRELVLEAATLTNVMGCEQGVDALVDEYVLAEIKRDGDKLYYAFVDDANMESEIADKLVELLNSDPILRENPYV